MKHRAALPVLLAALSAATTAHSQNYPDRPIRVLTAQSAGSSLDTIARIVTNKLSDQFGQQLVVDNRGGAAGTIALEIGARAVPDGYTMIVTGSSAMVVSRFTYKKLAFDAFKDFDAISLFANADGLMVVHPSVKAKSVKDLLALARAQPGKLNMASAGIGSSSHLSGLMFVNLSGIETVHVPYKGGGPMAASIVAGESHWAIGPAAALMGHVKAGRMRVLAITSRARSPLLPELPTVAESGVPGYEFSSWNGFFAPKGMSRPLIKTWHAAIQKALTAPEVKTQYAHQGMVPTGSASPEEFEKVVRADFERFGKLVKMAGIKPE